MPETIDDKFLANKKTEQDEFSDAFDEIEKGDPEFKKALHADDNVLNKDDTKGDSLNPDTADKKPADTVDSEAAVAQVDNTDNTVNTELFDGLKDSATNKQGNDLKDDRIAELEAALSKEQQKTASWDGRIKAANARADEAEAKAKSFEERLSALESDESTQHDKPNTGDKNETIKKFFDDFPEFEAPIRALIAEGTTGNKGVTLDEVKEAILPEVDEKLTKADVAASQNRFMAELKSYHADVVDLINSGEITKWIDTQPAYIAKELSRVYSGGTVEEAKALIDEFKRTSNWYKTKNHQGTQNTNKDAKLNSMLEVDSDSAGPPAGQPDTNDFDAAAAEAFKD